MNYCLARVHSWHERKWCCSNGYTVLLEELNDRVYALAVLLAAQELSPTLWVHRIVGSGNHLQYKLPNM